MALKSRLQESIQRGKVSELSAFSGFNDRMKNMVREEVEKFKDEAKEELKNTLADILGQEGFSALKGDKGNTPIKGIDFFTSEELENIKNEIRPLKGKDFFDGIAGRDGRDGRNASLKEIQFVIARELSKRKDKKFDIETMAGNIARSLEKLTGEQRLDYLTLKNRPGTPIFDNRGKTTARGGGDLVQISDLSASLNGSTSTFTVPSHTKALMLVGTQHPLIYRPTTDFTTLGTVLTLITSQVTPPSANQTLLFLYTF